MNDHLPMSTNPNNRPSIRPPHHIRHILTPKTLPHIPMMHRQRFLNPLFRIRDQLIRRELLVVGHGKDVDFAEEVGVAD